MQISSLGKKKMLICSVYISRNWFFSLSFSFSLFLCFFLSPTLSFFLSFLLSLSLSFCFLFLFFEHVGIQSRRIRIGKITCRKQNIRPTKLAPNFVHNITHIRTHTHTHTHIYIYIYKGNFISIYIFMVNFKTYIYISVLSIYLSIYV